MNVLDEHIPVIQRHLLRGWRVATRHIGYDVGHKGMQDDAIIPLLLALRQPTFFTLDSDYCRSELRHTRYCLVYLDVRREEAAIFIRRFLHHSAFDTQAQRMGSVVRVSYAGISALRLHEQRETHLTWE